MIPRGLRAGDEGGGGGPAGGRPGSRGGGGWGRRPRGRSRPRVRGGPLARDGRTALRALFRRRAKVVTARSTVPLATTPAAAQESNRRGQWREASQCGR